MAYTRISLPQGLELCASLKLHCISAGGSAQARASASHFKPMQCLCLTAGSVRVPASYCGLCGFRPSHERVSLQHSIPMAPSFDTGNLASSCSGTLMFCARLLSLRPAPQSCQKSLLLTSVLIAER